MLNSKIDFVQPMRTVLTTISKAANIAPGLIDRNQPTTRFRQTSTIASRLTNRKTVIGKRRKDSPTDDELGINFNPTRFSTPTKFTLDKEETIQRSPPRKRIKFHTVEELTTCRLLNLSQPKSL